MSIEPVDRDAEPTAPLDGAPAGAIEDQEELFMHLERDQLVAETFRPVARAKLSDPAAVGLWSLRIFAVLVSAMVIYTFVERLH